MPETQKQDPTTQYIVCPDCEGRGRIGSQPCSKCSSRGLGTFFMDRFLYWGLILNKPTIKLRRLRVKIDMILDVAAYIMGLLGVAALVWWIWNHMTNDIQELVFFWENKNWLILSFWVGMLAWLFIIYRKWKEILEEQRIHTMQPLTNISIPNNWEELKQYGYFHDTSKSYSRKSIKMLEDSYKLAVSYGHKQVAPVHLFSTLLGDKDIRLFMARLNVDHVQLRNKTKNYLDRLEPADKKEKIYLSKEVKKALSNAFIDAYKTGRQSVQPFNIIIPVVSQDEILEEILIDLKTGINKLKNVKAWFEIDERIMANYKKFKKMSRFKPKTTMNRAYTSLATPTLDQYGYDLTLAAAWGRLDLCVGRQKEMEDIFSSLESGKNGIILTGEQGVGKKTMIYGIAQKMTAENVPEFMRDKRLVELDVSRLISGSNASQAEERLLTIIEEMKRAGNILLYIKNVENLLGITSGQEQSLELSEVLADAIERKYLYCFATATNDNYINYIEESMLGNTMARIEIKEPVGNQAIHIIASKIGRMEGKFKVFFTYNAIASAIGLSSKFIHDKYQPVKALGILEKAAAKTSQKCNKKLCLCSQKEIEEIIEDITDIPTGQVTQEEGKQLLGLEDRIHKHFIDQEEAVNTVADSLRRARAELREGTKTIANFLFLGPTGVGKTELAKVITKLYFGNKKYMVRLDMSEYQHQDSVKKMIGDATGNRGYLTEAVRQNPYSLILLDEFEKAHPQILNLFLQVMDDGRLTTGRGKTIDFTNSIIIATSNSESAYIQAEVKKETPIERMKEELINERLVNSMPPELINRFDNIILFKPLSQDHIDQVAKLLLAETERILKAKGIKFKVHDQGVHELAVLGYDPEFGARPLKRVIQKKVTNIIAKKILANEVQRRDVVVLNKDGNIEIEKAEGL